MANKVVRLADRPTNAALVLAARDGDQAAKAELFHRYARMVANTAYRILGHDQELDDIIQDVFTSTLASLHELSDPQAFGAWLRRIAIGTTARTIRKRRLLARLGLLRPATIQLDELIAKSAPPDVAAELEQIYRAVQSLPTKERVVLVLHRVEQLTLAEVAEETGWSLSTVKRKLRSAAARLDRSFSRIEGK